jgi:hypothetical protein
MGPEVVAVSSDGKGGKSRSDNGQSQSESREEAFGEEDKCWDQSRIHWGAVNCTGLGCGAGPEGVRSDNGQSQSESRQETLGGEVRVRISHKYTKVQECARVSGGAGPELLLCQAAEKGAGQDLRMVTVNPSRGEAIGCGNIPARRRCHHQSWSIQVAAGGRVGEVNDSAGRRPCEDNIWKSGSLPEPRDTEAIGPEADYKSGQIRDRVNVVGSRWPWGCKEKS